MTKLNTPGGTPARAMISAKADAVAGTSSAGLSTTQLPNARAGAVFQAGIAIGKFHGQIIPTTPTGSRVISMSTPGRTEASLSPVSRNASPEKNRKICAARTVSPIPSTSGLPSSRERMAPISSLRASSSSPTRLRMSWRSCGVLRDQAGNASRAASIARAASAALAWGYCPRTSPVLDGLMSADVSAADTHSPAM